MKSCVEEVSGGKRGIENSEVAARRASTGVSPIRSLNFHLITALIKANRSERKRQFHYSELTVVAEWSKDVRESHPHIAIPGCVKSRRRSIPKSLVSPRITEISRPIPRIHLLWITTVASVVLSFIATVLFFNNGKNRKWQGDDSFTAYPDILVACMLPISGANERLSGSD